LASEVRDDIPAQLSEGEYVVPADVLRYYGVRFFEDLRAQAKQGMMEMEVDGRIGGTPVDAQGVPAGGQDEELTPEEEQMLMEALGASEAGMAYGGMVQPAPTPYQDQATMYQMPKGMAEGGDASGFDRTKFTLNENNVAGGGIEARRYINPTTKEVRTVNFLNGVALGLVPEGFVPWTQELADTPAAPTTPTTPTTPETPTTEKKDRDGGADRANQPTTGSTGGGSGGWAEKNYDTFSANPFEFGVKSLEAASKNNMGVIGKIGVGGIIGDVGKVKAISEANLALSKTTDEAQREILTEGIANLTESISSPLVYSGVKTGLLGSGKNLAKQVEEYIPTTPTAAPTAAPAAAPVAKPAVAPTSEPKTTVSTPAGIKSVAPPTAPTPAKSVPVKTTAELRTQVAADNAAKAAAAKAAVEKATAAKTAADKAAAANRAADKALTDKAKQATSKTAASKASTSKDTKSSNVGRASSGSASGGAKYGKAEGGLVGKPQKIERNKKGLAS
jgi:hypothetical protein